jgi:hypothetical protein
VSMCGSWVDVNEGPTQMTIISLYADQAEYVSKNAA